MFYSKGFNYKANVDYAVPPSDLVQLPNGGTHVWGENTMGFGGGGGKIFDCVSLFFDLIGSYFMGESYCWRFWDDSALTRGGKNETLS